MWGGHSLEHHTAATDDILVCLPSCKVTSLVAQAVCSCCMAMDNPACLKHLAKSLQHEAVAGNTTIGANQDLQTQLSVQYEIPASGISIGGATLKQLPNCRCIFDAAGLQDTLCHNTSTPSTTAGIAASAGLLCATVRSVLYAALATERKRDQRATTTQHSF